MDRVDGARGARSVGVHPNLTSGSNGKERQNRVRRAVPAHAHRTVSDPDLTRPGDEPARAGAVQHPVAQLSRDCLDNQFRCPQPGTILMGYPPLLLLRELPQLLPIPAVDNPD